MLSIKTNVQKSLENQNYSFVKSASCKNKYRQNMNDYVILQNYISSMLTLVIKENNI